MLSLKQMHNRLGIRKEMYRSDDVSQHPLYTLSLFNPNTTKLNQVSSPNYFVKYCRPRAIESPLYPFGICKGAESSEFSGDLLNFQ